MPETQERGLFFVRKIAQTTVTLFLVNALALISGIITARVLGPSDKGIFTLLNLYPMVLSTFMSLSIYRALTVHIAEGAIEFRRLPATLIAYGFFASAIIIGIFAVIFYSMPHYFVQGIPAWVIFTSLGMIPFIFIVQTFSSLLEVKGYVTLVNFKDLFNSVVLLLAITVGLLLLHARVIGANIAYVVSHMLTAFFVIWLVRRIDRGPWVIDIAVLFRVIADGARLHISVIASFILARIGMFILGYLKPSASLGYYSIAVSISEILFILMAAIQMTFYSEVSNLLLDRKAMVRRTIQIYRHSLVLFILGACGLALVSRMLIIIFYGRTFLPALQPLLILLPGALVLYLHNIFAIFLISNRRFMAVSLICVISSVVNIILNFFLIPVFDFNGAALASATTYVFNATVLLVLFFRESELSLKDFIRELKFTSQDFAFYGTALQRFIVKINRQYVGYLKKVVQLKEGSSEFAMMNFIFFSINNWEKRKARKQHFALELSKRSDVKRVVYVEPALNFWRGILLPWKEFKTKENRMRWKRALRGSRHQINEKLSVLSPIFFVPFAIRFQLAYDINMYFLSIWLQHLLKPDTQSVLWFYNPFDRVLMRYLKPRALTIFDWVEDWQQYFMELSILRRAGVGYLQEDMIRRSDLVFVVSQAMHNRVKQLNGNTFYVRDGTVPEVFVQQPVSQEVLNLRKPVCGYLGTLNHRVDGGLLLSLAKRFPDISFLLIGEVLSDKFDAELLAQTANVYLIGSREYYTLGAYSAIVDIWLLPYKTTLTEQLPTKVFDYLITGKPIVSTRISALKGLEHFFYIGDTFEQIAVCIERALQEDNPEFRSARIVFASNNSWQIRTEQIVGYINKKR